MEQQGIGRSYAFKLAGEMGDISQVNDLGAAKLLKVKLECQRIARQLEIDAGNWMHKETIREETIKTTAVIKACLEALISVLPGQLEGLTAAQMTPVIEREVRKTMEAMSRGA